MTTNTLIRIDGDADTIRELTRRVQAEYAEMPGLSVTLAQARRLLATDEPTCAEVFELLIKRGVLRRTPQGRYVRALNG
jgi:Holliday junction resolvasome RuvABC ATP-dependent DNA helicase subunit